jgi:multiple sugar transport system ATP-binding protein
VAAVTLRHVTRSFGRTAGLEEIDLAVADGEFCVVVGPSGCGKSTLLRALAGLEPIDRGRIEIGGRDVQGVPPRERDVAFVFQSYALYPHLTVRGNLEFPLRARAVAAAEREMRVREAAELLRIADLLERRPRELSGGQRQRVAIGRAVVRRPQVFLFDEPLSNLDARLRSRMRVELIELHRKLGITSIYVTHDQAEAMTLAQKLVVMHHGRIRQVGPPHDVYDRPADAFVADFVGTPSMNFFEGTIESPHEFRTPDFALRAPGSLAPGPVVLGVRPEDLIASDGPIPARVAVVEDLGSETYVHAQVGDAAVIFRCESSAPAPAPGDAVNLGIRERRMHWFRDGIRVSDLGVTHGEA